jgi:acyl carrier protein
MDKTQILSLICRRLREMSATKGAKSIQVSSATSILGATLPVDSLDLAALLVELEGATGKDPFRDGFISFHTVGELAQLYYGAE